MVIHCQVITSQVMMCRLGRDCPVIGGGGRHGAAAGSRKTRKVILTTLSVSARCFGRVTASAGPGTARAGHAPAWPRREAPAERVAGRRPGPAAARYRAAERAAHLAVKYALLICGPRHFIMLAAGSAPEAITSHPDRPSPGLARLDLRAHFLGAVRDFCRVVLGGVRPGRSARSGLTR